MKPSPRLFHLHYHVPDVAHAERVLADAGLPLFRRFGTLDGESTALLPEDEVPERFDLRLENVQRGDANVTLAPGPALRFDHFGVFTPEFDAVTERARDADWTVTSPEGRRPFLVTPWGFRIECHADGADVESTLGPWEDAHFEAAELAVPDPDAVRAGIEAVLGAIPELRVGRGESVSVPTFRLGGTAFPDGRVLSAEGLRGQ